MNSKNQAPRVCIIGGGPSGLASLRFVSKVTPNVILFESKSEVGGMWVSSPYSEINHPNLEEDLFYKYSGYLHSSMYTPLTTNLPFPSLSYVGFPFKRTPQPGTFQDQNSSENSKSDFSSDYLTQTQYLAYIQNYSTYFQLHPFIRLSHYVKSVRHFPSLTSQQQASILLNQTSSHQPKFILQVLSLSSENEQVTHVYFCDYLIVANGHYSAPYIPQVEGLLTQFKGSHFHMHHLRSLEQDTHFPGKKILLVGYRYGGMDLLQNLLFKYPHNFETIHVSTQSTFHQQSQDLRSFIDSNKLRFHKRLTRFNGPHSAEFQDGQSLEDIDVVIWATGYQFAFPFFNQSQTTMCDGLLDIYARRESLTHPSASKAFGPLYLRALCGREPGLMFAGLVTAYGNGMVYDYQGMLFASIIGKFLMITSQSLLQLAQSEEKYFRSKVPSMMKYLQFTSHFTPFDYLDQIIALLGFDTNEQEEPTRILKAIMEQWVYHFKAGDFRKVKQIAVTEKYLSGGQSSQFEWKVPNKLFKVKRYLIKPNQAYL